jgi:PAS domain S-box-containing protein
MKILKKISFKFWILFTTVLIVIFTLFLFYYPQKQRELIYKYRGKELQELANTIAYGTEISLETEDFNKLTRAMNFFRNRSSEFDFIVMTYLDTLNKTEDVLNVISELPSFNYDKTDTSKFLIKNKMFKTKKIYGNIKIGVLREKIESVVYQINRPVYFVLIIVFFSATFILFLFINNITKPIVLSIKNAQYLTSNQFDKFIEPEKTSQNEVGQLLNSLSILKETLQIQKKQNEELTHELESMVLKRTEQLNEALGYLKDSQSLAKISNFIFGESLNTFIYSENISEITGIQQKQLLNYETFLSWIVESKDIQNILETIVNSGVFEHELFNKNSNKWLYIKINRVFDETKTRYYYIGIVQDISSQKNREIEIKRLSMLAEKTTNCVIFTDKNKRIIWVNDSVLRLTGYSREEIIGNKPSMFQFEETDEKTKRIIKAKLSNHESVHTEILNKGKNGNTYWIELYIEPLINENREIDGYMAIEIDISERKEKERLINSYINDIRKKQIEIESLNRDLELKVEEKTRNISRLASFPEEFESPIIEIDCFKNQLSYANPSARKILFDKLSLTNNNVLDLFDTQSGTMPTLKKQIKISNHNFELNFFSKDNGNTIRIFFYDITEQVKNKEESVRLINELLNKEKELKQKTDELEDAIRSLKISQGEVIKKEKLATLGMLISGIAHEINTPLGAIKASSDNLEYMFFNDLVPTINNLSDADIQQAFLFYYKHRDESEKSTRELRELEKVLIKKLDKLLNEENQIKQISKKLISCKIFDPPEELIALLSDYNKSNAILDFINLLNNLERSIKTIGSAALKSSKIIKALNTYSHQTESEEKSNFNLKDSVENVFTLLWNKLKQKYSYKNLIPRDLMLFGYEDELSQVWTNIINNAIQASPNGCNIVVLCNEVPDYTEVIIENDGPQIPESDLSKIFDEFFTTKKRGEGTGLGLNIVKKMIEKHDGKISCESNAAKTKFIIHFPKTLKS